MKDLPVIKFGILFTGVSWLAFSLTAEIFKLPEEHIAFGLSLLAGFSFILGPTCLILCRIADKLVDAAVIMREQEKVLRDIGNKIDLM